MVELLTGVTSVNKGGGEDGGPEVSPTSFPVESNFATMKFVTWEDPSELLELELLSKLPLVNPAK